jgi:hypothetical protein
MECIQGITLEVPLWQMAFLLVILIICLAIGRHTLGLMGAVLFVMYWGYIYNFDKFFSESCRLNHFALGFLLSGGINLLLIMILFIYAFSLKE